MSTTTDVARVLIEHTRINGIHGDCSCGIVVQPGRRFSDHQAEALHAAGLLRRDIQDDYGLSVVRVTARLGGPTHVHIERAGVPIVDGYLAGPEEAFWQHRQHRPELNVMPYIDHAPADYAPPAPDCSPALGAPRRLLEDRLRALADDSPPFTAAVLRQFADEVAQLREGA